MSHPASEIFSSAPPSAEHSLQCMEIWASNTGGGQSATTPGIAAHVFSRPFQGDAQGGDIHYISLCGGGVITRALLADVSGHGSAVASVARELRQIVRKNINNPSQERLVRSLNEQFFALHQSRVFATAVVATFLPGQNRLLICNAGHPRPLFYRARAGAWSLLSDAGPNAAAVEGDDEPGNLPLGIFAESPFAQFALSISPGDLALLYTDHFIEARDAAGKPLQEEGLLAMARGIPVDSPQAAADALLRRLENYRHGPPDDDITLLALTCTERKKHRWRLGERASVYAKWLGLRAV